MIAEDKVESELCRGGKSKNSTNESVSLTNGPLILQVSDWNLRNDDTWKYSHYIIWQYKRGSHVCIAGLYWLPWHGYLRISNTRHTETQYGNVLCRLDLGRESWWFLLIHPCLFVCSERYFIFIFTSWTYEADTAHQIQVFILITKIKHDYVDKTLVWVWKQLLMAYLLLLVW